MTSNIKPPFFSIVIATYNRAHLLERAIESVLKQSYKNWELLVVDDGSTDETSIKMKKFLEQDSRIIFLQKTHSGLSETRNYGLQKARGKWICFLDSDDQFKPQHLKENKKIIDSDSKFQVLYGKVDVYGNPFVPDKNNLSQKIHLDNCIHIGALFILRKKLSEVGGFPVVNFSEDSALFEKLVEQKFLMKKTFLKTYWYDRTQPDSICNRIQNAQLTQRK
ncbi:MAG: glycosyltransferase family 2 protein [Deltaproteobacteria bacterium]|nr:glycosyltransferase family 2 protein [Deltaproteobacteria bacterium]